MEDLIIYLLIAGAVAFIVWKLLPRKKKEGCDKC
jgi:hypothetical protein